MNLTRLFMQVARVARTRQSIWNLVVAITVDFCLWQDCSRPASLLHGWRRIGCGFRAFCARRLTPAIDRLMSSVAAREAPNSSGQARRCTHPSALGRPSGWCGSLCVEQHRGGELHKDAPGRGDFCEATRWSPTSLSLATFIDHVYNSMRFTRAQLS